MKPSGPNLTTKQEAAILALLTCATVTKAAKSCRVAEVTLWRWHQEPAFVAAYAQARRKAMEQALTTLQKATSAATEALVSLMADKETPPAVRVSACRSILEYAFRGTELIETEARLQVIEQTLAAQNGRGTYHELAAPPRPGGASRPTAATFPR